MVLPLQPAAGMTPFSLHKEIPTRRTWPRYAWAVVAGATLSTVTAVVLLAWQASRTMMPRQAAPAAGPTYFESAADVRNRVETDCRAVDTMRATGTGIYAADFEGVWR